LKGLDELVQISHFLLQFSDDVAQGADATLCAPDVSVTQAVIPERFVETLELMVDPVEASIGSLLLTLELLVKGIEAPVGGTLLVDEPPVDGVETPFLCLQVGNE